MKNIHLCKVYNAQLSRKCVPFQTSMCVVQKHTLHEFMIFWECVKILGNDNPRKSFLSLAITTHVFSLMEEHAKGRGFFRAGIFLFDIKFISFHPSSRDINEYISYSNEHHQFPLHPKRNILMSWPSLFRPTPRRRMQWDFCVMHAELPNNNNPHPPILQLTTHTYVLSKEFFCVILSTLQTCVSISTRPFQKN